MPKRLEIVVGSKHNHLTIIKETDPEIRYNKGLITPLRRVDCACDCGKIINTRVSSLLNGTTKSCGCFKNKNLEINRVKHGLSKETLYHIWGGIIQRCENQKHPRFKDYGGRGISICEEWRNDFLTFYNWAIENKWSKGLEIDRRNNDGNYDASNCRIVTGKVNCNNTRRCRFFEYMGLSLTLTQICEMAGLSYKTVYQRIFKYNWSFNEAINKPTA